MFIHIIGPGAAGKTTTGMELAGRIGFKFIDLDKEYPVNKIEQDIKKLGYQHYVHENIENYVSLIKCNYNAVIATSSGFMTYKNSAHPKVKQIHESILSDKNTILVLPSFEEDKCVLEITNRQMQRKYQNNIESEHKTKIKQRFPIYSKLDAIKIETNKPVAQVVDIIIPKLQLLTNHSSQTREKARMPVS